MSSVLKNYRKIHTSQGGDPSLPPRVTTLENNEYKVTYYEVIQGTSGTLVVPSQGTINSDEFGLSGNAILSKIDANGKPTYESPTTSLGVAVTTSLDVSTGAWVVSGVYTDPNVAVIYSIRIKAIYYSNLTYNNIIETIDLAVTKTSQLINDGDNGVSHFISLEDLPSSLILYPTNVASGISTYTKLVNSITDPSYNTVAVNIPTGTIVASNQFIAGVITSAGLIVGNPGQFNITTIGNIQKLSGTGDAEFYFEIYKRTSGGVETLITTSGNTLPVVNSGYAEFSASALWNDGIWSATDYIVMKFYGSHIHGGSNPTYQFQFGGVTPVRTLVPLPLVVIPNINLDDLQDVTIASVTNNDILTYESSTSLWKNKTVTTALGYTPANQDGTILYHSLKWFTPSSTVSSSGTTVTSIGAQFTLAMVGSKLTINGESKIITVYNATTIVTVASAYSTNYSGVIAGNWGVYSKVIEITPNQYSYFSIYDSFGVLNTRTDGTQFYIKNFRTLNNNLNILDTGFVLGGSRTILWTNDTGSSNSAGGVLDTGLRRNAAGILEIYNGITADGLLANRRDLLVRDITSSSITTPTINGVSGLLSFGSTDKVSVGNYATPSAQRIFTVGQDTAFISIGSLVGSTSFSALYMNNTATPSGANYTLRGSSSDTTFNCPSSMYFSRTDNIFATFNFGMRSTWNMLANPFGYTPYNFTRNAVTGATASTALSGWIYTGGSTQWPTGNITTQSEIVWGATTYSFVGASTIDTAYGNVFNAPIAGTNATITNNWAAQFNGNVVIGSTNQLTEFKQTSTAPTLTQTGSVSSSIYTISGGLQVRMQSFAGAQNWLFATGGRFLFGTSDSQPLEFYTATTKRMEISAGGILNFYGATNYIDAVNITFATTTGTKIGTTTTQKLSFWAATPIVQPATGGGASTFVSNTSLLANDTATFDGYTIGQVVKALRNMGLLA